MSYLCVRKQDPAAGTKGIMCGGVFLPVENYEAGAPTPAEQIPTSGMVFYLPCDSSDYTTAQTGQSLTKTGTVTAKTVDGIPCLEIKSGSYLTGTLDGFSGDVSMAMSFWVKRRDSNSSAYITAGRGNYSLSGGDEIWASVESDHIETACGSSGSDTRRAGIYNATIGTGWHHGYFSYDATSKKFKTVLDGNTENAGYSAERSYNFSSGLMLCINSLARATSAIKGNADYSRIRIFNRALSDAEIKLLAREFVFNSAPVEGKKGLLIPVGESVAAPPANGLVFSASYAEDMTDADGESPTEGTGYTIVEDAAGFKCLDVEKSNMQNSISYAETQEKMQFGTGNFAVGFYLKSMKPWANYNGIILTNVLADSGFTGFVFYKNRDSGKKSMVVRFDGGDLYSDSDVDTNWHHWLFMRDGDTVKLYKDGKVDATKAYSGTVNAHEDLYIGGYYSNWSSFTSAYFRLSNVRIYNRALTDAEIQSVAYEHNPAKKLFIPLQTAYGTPQVGQKGIIVRSSQVLGHLGAYSKSAETMPTDGLTLYASLAEASETAETGQALTVNNGGITYQTLDGIPCMTKGGTSAYLSVPISFTGSFTLSFWIRTTYTGNYVGMAYVGGLSIFDSVDSSKKFQLSAKKSSSERADFSGISNPLKWRDGAWHHIALSITSEESRLYCDGTLVSTASGVTPSISATMAYIGYDNDGDYALASYAMWRAYKRALSDAEISTLSGEYKREEIKKVFIAVKEQSAVPDDGLIFYAPLQEDKSTAETEQALTKNGTITYQTYKGIPCAHFSSAYISSQLSDYITPYPMTFAIWAAPDTTDSRALWSFSNDKPLMYWNGSYHVYDPDCNVSTANVGDWHHIAWSINSDRSSTYYFDGVAMGTTTSNNTSTIKSLCIGYRNGYQPQWVGYLAGFRIYNRALSADEISALANEYTPEA